jgi:hypothetical protein
LFSVAPTDRSIESLIVDVIDDVIEARSHSIYIGRERVSRMYKLRPNRFLILIQFEHNRIQQQYTLAVSMR